ncbi:tripartite tricarboxylate transporter substrate binding protein [Comamonadaceae bacterium G21597-S1]|nr:tripartite tricarboxylate transporter substrate binding protein [Comamonadaceae bacterium G21597-S1]
MRLILAMLLAALASLVNAQAAYPERPVRLVVPFPPGGSTDVTARILASKLAEKWGQSVVVENKPGAGANIGTEYAAKAAPDGYTLLLATTAMSISPSVFAKLGYDAVRDLAPITLVSTIPSVLVVHPSVPANTMAEFVAHAKANPRKLNFAAPGAASGQRMTFELLNQALGMEIVMVPFAGGPPALQAVLAGHVQAMITNVVEAAAQVRAGKLRALAVTTGTRAALLPEVPTVAETVAPQMDTYVWQALFAPAGTPAAVLQKVHRDASQVLLLPDVKARLADLGMNVVPGTPEALGAFLREDLETWGKVSKAAGITPQ